MVALAVLSISGRQYLLRVRATGFNANAAKLQRLRGDIARLNADQNVPATPELATADTMNIPVYFGTTRVLNKAGSDPDDAFADKEDTGILRYGLAHVQIPATHRPGETDSRGWCRTRLIPACRSSRKNTVTVIGLATMDGPAWQDSIRAALSQSERSDILLFVHGYNSSFNDALQVAGQLSYDIGFTGVTATFSWASAHATLKYVVDQEVAERSVTALKAYIRTLVATTSASHIFIVAHSMGTRLVSYALRDLSREPSPPTFNHVVFAAPDIDSASFMNELADPVVAHSRWLTVYASNLDSALLVSSSALIHDARRVGSGPPTVVLHERMDYIDASNVRRDELGHSYYHENAQLLRDIHLLIKDDLPAEHRCIPIVTLDSARSYFQFPPENNVRVPSINCPP